MRECTKVICVIVYIVFRTTAQLLPPPTVILSHGGALRGSYLYSVQGRVIDAFLGIPYAQPPVGPLRFSDPEPMTGWHGLRDAIQKPDPCYQFDALGSDKTPFGSEDCLYLNVYTPRDRSSNAPLSVMVWFHGGAFYVGSSDPILYGPERLLDNDVVLVTCNYRLGAFGFLSTQTMHAPGNYGLKDQNLVLRWVREYISSFGGNYDDVTIFGQSAGAASVSLHMVAPPSAELFHKAILQSGNYFDKWAIVRKNRAIERAQQLARHVQCPVPTDDDYFAMIACLRNVNAPKLVSALLSFFVFPTNDPLTIFGPVIEPISPNAFLTRDPRDVQNSYGENVPIIIGALSDDGLVRSAAIINQLSREFEQNFETILPIMLFYDHKPSQVQAKLTRKIKKYYFHKGFEWSRRNHQNLTDMFSDRFFFSGMELFLRKRLKSETAADTYVYIFDHNGPKSITEAYGGGSKYYGVCHGDELPFLFTYGQLGFKSRKRDRQIHWALPKMWTDFAKTGDPTPSDTIITQRWRRAHKYPFRYVRIGAKNSHSRRSLFDEDQNDYRIEDVASKATEYVTDDTYVPNDTFVPDDTYEPYDAYVPDDTYVLDDTYAPHVTDAEEATYDNNNQYEEYTISDKSEPIFETYEGFRGTSDANFHVDYVEPDEKDLTRQSEYYGDESTTHPAVEHTNTTANVEQWKHSSSKSRRCYIYTTRDPCAVLNNKKDRFWNGFHY